MKRWLLLMIAIVMFTGCNASKYNSNKKDISSELSSEEIIYSSEDTSLVEIKYSQSEMFDYFSDNYDTFNSIVEELKQYKFNISIYELDGVIKTKNLAEDEYTNLLDDNKNLADMVQKIFAEDYIVDISTITNEYSSDKFCCLFQANSETSEYWSNIVYGNENKIETGDVFIKENWGYSYSYKE